MSTTDEEASTATATASAPPTPTRDVTIDDSPMVRSCSSRSTSSSHTSFDAEPPAPIPPPIREVTIDESAIVNSSNSKSSSRSSLEARRRQFKSQPSTVATRRQQAVCVRRAHKSYGPKSNKNIVLDGLNMTVPNGSM